MSVAARRLPQGGPEDELTLAQIVAEMQRLRKVMDRDQAEIDRLKAETRAIKLESHAVDAETRLALDRLAAMVKPC